MRTGPGDYDVQLVPPPFAIRFAGDGTIAQGTDDNVGIHPSPTPATWDRLVYVSPTGSTTTLGSGTKAFDVVNYDISRDRVGFGGTVDLDRYGYRGTERMADGRVQLPLGAIETVSGVLLLEPERVPREFAHPDGGGQETIYPASALAVPA